MRSLHIGVPALVMLVMATTVAADAYRDSAEGRPLPDPPGISVMRELDAACHTLLPADPRYHILGRRGPGPNTAASAFRTFPRPPAPPEVTPPHGPRTFTLTYDFDSELPGRAQLEALKAVQYAQAIQARQLSIVGYRGAALLSDGTLVRELPAIGRLRAWHLARMVRRLGLPASIRLTMRWSTETEPADGVTDAARRRATLIVTP